MRSKAENEASPWSCQAGAGGPGEGMLGRGAFGAGPALARPPDIHTATLAARACGQRSLFRLSLDSFTCSVQNQGEETFSTFILHPRFPPTILDHGGIPGLHPLLEGPTADSKTPLPYWEPLRAILHPPANPSEDSLSVIPIWHLL